MYQFPDLDLEDASTEIAAMRAELAESLRVPRRWTGRLRRTALARAIQGSKHRGVSGRGDVLEALIRELGPRAALDDPYPWMVAKLASVAAGVTPEAAAP